MSEEREGGAGLPEEEFSAILNGIGAAAPVVRALMRPPVEAQIDQSDPCARREALLCALKPYLSRERCEAVDYLLRMWRTKEAIRAIGGLHVHSTDV